MRKIRANASFIISVLTILAAMLVAGLAGDYFFDLNDDVLMKDILSGAYTGVPEGNNIQMLYPISLFISVLYRIGTNIDWYGIFLCFIQYFCFFIVVFRSLEHVKDMRFKILVAASELFFILGFFSTHLLFVQYTVVCGLLSATAAFLILAADKKDHVLAVILIFIAYLLRSEMLLLTLPLVGVAIFINWVMARSKVQDKKALFMRYVILCASIVACLVVGTVIDKLGYSSAEWKEFVRLFDNRTELYDFQYIPEYEGNSDFYESIGLSRSEQKLLENYNFALDEEINADTLGQIAKYAADTRGEEVPVSERLYKALRLYIYRLHYLAVPVSYEYPMTDCPWNFGVIILYLAVVVLYAFGRGKEETEKENPAVVICLLALLFACRSALWMFIIFRGRDPIRITHPLYLSEIFILFAMLLHGTQKKIELSKLKVYPTVCAFVVILITGAIMSIPQFGVVKEEAARREETMASYRELNDYMAANPEAFYYVDVYTSVSYVAVKGADAAPFTEKMFDKVDNGCYNHDILGGWASKSPLYVKKLHRAGFDNVQDALLEDNVYFVQNKTEDVEWLEEYYRDKGYNVSVEANDTVADIFTVYKVRRAY